MTALNRSAPSSFRFLELTPEENLEFLRSKHIGRIVWCIDGAPQALPVNYVVHDDTILFRTSPYASIARAAQAETVAFEIDEIDEYVGTGWSVLVVGNPEAVEDPEDLPRAVTDRPFPWAPGTRNLYIRIHPRSLTGRRVLSAI